MSRILINLLAVTDGGQVTRANEFLNRFGTYDGESKLTILRRSGTLPFCDSITNATVINVAIGDSAFRPWFRLFWENFNLRLVLKEIRPEVYLSFSHYLPSSIGSNVTSILGVTNLAPFSPMALSKERFGMKVKMKLLRYGIIASARKASHVVALSNLCKKILINHGINKNNITVINNGVNHPQDEDTCFKSDLNVQQKFILYVSSFFHYKNFKLLINAYASLSDDMKDEYQLVLVGRVDDVAYFNELHVLVDTLNLWDKIKFVDEVQREELEVYYETSSLFVFPSLIENCPNILLEALSFGCPILCSSVEPMNEFGGDAVAYFDPYSEVELRKLMQKTLDDPEVLRKMSKLSRERSKRFSWDLFTESVVDLMIKN